MQLFCSNHSSSTLEALRDIYLSNAGDANILAVNYFYSRFSLMHEKGWGCQFLQGIYSKDLCVNILNSTHILISALM